MRSTIREIDATNSSPVVGAARGINGAQSWSRPKREKLIKKVYKKYERSFELVARRRPCVFVLLILKG